LRIFSGINFVKNRIFEKNPIFKIHEIFRLPVYRSTALFCPDKQPLLIKSKWKNCQKYYSNNNFTFFYDFHTVKYCFLKSPGAGFQIKNCNILNLLKHFFAELLLQKKKSLTTSHVFYRDKNHKMFQI